MIYTVEVPLTVIGKTGKPGPLTLNHRMHWAVKARHVAAIRDAVAWGARKIPPAERVFVTLHYCTGNNRALDEDNLVATLKPCVDGLVDAGVVRDDGPDYVKRDMPQVHLGKGTRKAWLSIET